MLNTIRLSEMVSILEDIYSQSPRLCLCPEVEDEHGEGILLVLRALLTEAYPNAVDAKDNIRCGLDMINYLERNDLFLDRDRACRDSGEVRGEFLARLRAQATANDRLLVIPDCSF